MDKSANDRGVNPVITNKALVPRLLNWIFSPAMLLVILDKRVYDSQMSRIGG